MEINLGAPGVKSRPQIDAQQDSLIRRVAHAGMGRDDVIALWFGEADDPTPEFIRKSAVAALDAGHTLYPSNRGIPELLPVMSDYMTALHGRPIGEDRVTVTASAMNAIIFFPSAEVLPPSLPALPGWLWPPRLPLTRG